MGCDYYIIKELLIEYPGEDEYDRWKPKSGDNMTIELDRKREYFPYTNTDTDTDIDSDDSDYSEKTEKQYAKRRNNYIKIKEECLKVHCKPIILFENNWKNKETESKYFDMFKTVKPGFIRVTKREIRYLR
jgi:hypothetical protein